MTSTYNPITCMAMHVGSGAHASRQLCVCTLILTSELSCILASRTPVLGEPLTCCECTCMQLGLLRILLLELLSHRLLS